jgi:hypothetical protein
VSDMPDRAAMTDTSPPPPSSIRVTGRFDPELSRGLWLVTWLLLIPHLIVLAVLGAVFWVLTVVAFVAILDRALSRVIFGVTSGVLRNADGSAPVLASVSAGVQAPVLRPLSAGVLLGGGALLLLGVVGIAVAARARPDEGRVAVG